MKKQRQQWPFHLVVLILATHVLCGFAQDTWHFQANGVNQVIGNNIIQRLNAEKLNILQSQLINKRQLLINQSNKMVRQAIAPFGYLRPKITRTIKRRSNNTTLIFNIQLGPPVIIASTNIQINGPGKNTKAFQHILHNNPIIVGNQLNIKQYNNFNNQLFSAAAEHGYFQAKMDQREIIINQNHNQAHIIIHFNTGKASVFGPTHFPNVPLSITLLRRFQRFKKGDPYRLSKTQYLQHALANSNYFRVVNVTPQLDSRYQNNIPININLKMNHAQQYRFGLGYGTDTGPRATLGAQWRYLNQYGHHLNLALRGSQRSNGATANYVIPGRKPDINFYTIIAGFDQQDITDVGKSNATQIGIRYTTRIWGWQQQISLIQLNERYNLSTTPTVNTSLIYPSIQWVRRKVNDSVRPTNGYRITLRLSGTSGITGKQHAFAQVFLDTRLLYSVFENNTRLFLRGSIGYTSINQIQQLPLSLQLLAGGSQSVRGYGYNTIGPGKILTVGTAELQQRIYRDFFATSFYDAGRVNNTFSGHVYQSTGPGLMWLSPIGSIELTMARTLSEKTPQWRFDFSMGALL